LLTYNKRRTQNCHLQAIPKLAIQRRMLRMIKWVLVSLVLLVAPLCAQDATTEPPFDVDAPYAILIDARSGNVFFEKNADQSVPPASMSKLMLQSMVFDALKKGDLKPDQEFTVTEDAWRRGGSPAGGSTMYAELNSKVSVMNLLRGAIIQSANDACIVLATGIAGSEQAFVSLMNRRAKELGLKNSTFGNSTGLPDPYHKMSMRDLAEVARYIITNHPDYFKIYGESHFIWNKIDQQNRNPLLKEYAGADGMKTGYTKEAGYGLVGTAEREGRRLIMVIGGVTSIATRRDAAQKLLDYGFNQFKPFDVYESGEQVASVRVWGGESRWVDLLAKDSFKISLAPQEQDSVEIKLDFKGPLIAPVEKGTEIGKIRILVGGKTVADTTVVTGGSVVATNSMWRKALDSALIMIFGG
jgi:D-alanyl-D-alanine carboxypeptidase (penicillin-binding protein 5/6)